ENGKIYDDLSTVNFFMVPKFLVGETDGKMGQRNGVMCGGIEKKMGIKGSATCVLNFDEAKAWRLGPKPQPKVPGEEKKKSSSAGMSGMFGMMNMARLGVGVQGVAIAEAAYQNGLAYAHERRVGRALTGPAEPDKPADLLIVHPDVRRMLLHCRSFIEGARAVTMWTMLNMNIMRSNRADAQEAALISDLLTPVIKAFFTDMGFECANMAMQIYGGHGYIRDNGVQAMDLVGRKLGRKGGEAPMALFNHINGWLTANEGDAKLAPFVKPVQRGLGTLQQATMWLAQHGMQNPNDAGAAATDYLRMMGIVVLGFMWARMAKVAQAKLAAGTGNKAFYE